MSIPHFAGKFFSKPLFNPSDFLAYLERIGKPLSHRPAPDAVILSYQKSLFDHVVEHYSVERAQGYFGQFIYYLDGPRNMAQDTSQELPPDQGSQETVKPDTRQQSAQSMPSSHQSAAWGPRRLQSLQPQTRRQLAIAAGFGVGAPAAAVMLEELIAWGVRDFVSMGMAGSLREDLPPGSIVLCDSAIRDEGTSYHYLPYDSDVFPDRTLTEKLANELSAAGLPFSRGATWTTDAIYRETPAEVEYFRKKGALVVEMEAAALFAVAAHRNARIASCFSVSDTLAFLEWKPEFHSEATQETLEKLFRVACKALQG